MCNALSPERAVMWSVLHEGRADPRLAPRHFTHDAYRRWFEALNDADPSALDAIVQDGRERRALDRMRRTQPPQRIRDNFELFVQALLDRDAGQAIHVERLIN